MTKLVKICPEKVVVVVLINFFMYLFSIRIKRIGSKGKYGIKSRMRSYAGIVFLMSGK